MKRTPQLEFVYDSTLDNALHIERLMKREEEVLGSEAPEIFVDGETADGPRAAQAALLKALPADLAAVCRRMKTERAVALAVHEKPDTDALGAAAGMLDLFAPAGRRGSPARRPR